MAATAPIFDLKLPRGLDFTLQNSPTPEKYLIETMPGGVALFDYNNDGLLDIFLVNGGHLTRPMQLPEKFDRANPRYILTERGVGYKFAPPPPQQAAASA